MIELTFRSRKQNVPAYLLRDDKEAMVPSRVVANVVIQKPLNKLEFVVKEAGIKFRLFNQPDYDRSNEISRSAELFAAGFDLVPNISMTISCFWLTLNCECTVYLGNVDDTKSKK